jgi:endoglycosylceramidase
MRGPIRTGVLVLAVAAVLVPSIPSPAAPHGPPPLGHHGRWLTDAKGRVVILHGINMVAKLPPYDASKLGFDDDDAELLEQAGFDTVRLGLILKAVEPTRGHFDDAYLSSIARTARILGRHGLRVIVDFHQDLFNERINGEGFPDWAVQDDGLPAQPDAGFPGNYFVMPALWRAYDHLWANDDGLQDAYASAWQHVAQRFRGERSIAGYDTFNEPWPGSDWQTCMQPAGCPLFDQTLTSFYTKVFHAIRTVDPDKMVFYEPHPQMSGTGANVSIGDTGDPNAGFSFHFYCLDALGWPGSLGAVRCPAGEDRPFDVADAVSERNGDALLMSEFGASDDLDNLALNLDLLDRHMMSWQYWTYFGRDTCCERPAEGIIVDPSKPPRGDNVKWDKVRMLTRPYPRAVAGTPVSYVFDPGAKDLRFELVYRTDPSIHAPTEIFVPTVRYASGYHVVVSGPARVISGPNAELLELRTTGAGTVHVTITAA